MTRHLVGTMILAAGILSAHDDRYSARGGYGRYDDYDDGYDSYEAPPPPVAPVHSYGYRRPAMPGPNYAWVDPCWRFNRGRYVWMTGYWAPRPFAGAYWVSPRYSSGRFFVGYWGGGPRGGYGRYRYDRGRGGYGYRR